MSATRALVFVLVGYFSLLVEGALALLVPGKRTFLAAPELGLFVVAYLGLAGRGGAVGLTLSALLIGYLRDLLIGAPRGSEALTFAIVALLARALHGRVFLERYGQLAVVAVAVSTLQAMLIVLLAGGDAPLAASLRSLPGLAVSALLFGPICLRLLRRLDLRLIPEARGIRFEGDLGRAWR